MDKIEQYIINNKDLFNDAVPSERVWEGIASSLEESDLKEVIQSAEVSNQAPSPRVWESIAQELGQERETSPAKEVKMVPLKRVWQLAASFAILLVSIVWLQYYLQQSSQSAQILAMESSEEVSPSERLEEEVPDLLEAEQYYMSVIQKHQTSLKQYSDGQPSLDSEGFTEDIAHLDSVYRSMKDDLAEQPSNQRVVNAMIENLQLRMNILSRQLQLMEQLQQIKEGSRKQLDASVFES